MKEIIIYILRFGLNVVYMILKLLPVQPNKVLFLSRQSNQLTLDFAMTQEALRAKRKEIKIVTLCNRLEGEDSGGMVRFAWTTLKSMYHMATSRVCVLDAYWPAVSILHHKKSLTVIQMWHALGKIKQSGYQTLDKESGRSGQIARLMKMHENYDYIIAGGKAWNPYYCQSFHTTEDKLVNCGLPRIDHLLRTAASNREEAMKAYPQFQGKTVILYAPTFRRNIALRWEELADAAQAAGESCVLIVKGHPNQKLDISRWQGVYDCPEFKAVDLLAACDYLITDYSAIAVEGAILNRPTYYFVYDYEEYREKNGMNIDLFQEMPGCVFRNGRELMKQVLHGEYPWESLKAYQKKFLPEHLGTSTEQIAELIINSMQ